MLVYDYTECDKNLQQTIILRSAVLAYKKMTTLCGQDFVRLLCFASFVSQSVPPDNLTKS